MWKKRERGVRLVGTNGEREKRESKEVSKRELWSGRQERMDRDEWDDTRN